MNVIALEGNPGIGKTTAVRRYLEATNDGYLFIYVSPRVVLNRDVTESLARKNGHSTGILTLTSNAQLNAGQSVITNPRLKRGWLNPTYRRRSDCGWGRWSHIPNLQQHSCHNAGAGDRN